MFEYGFPSYVLEKRRDVWLWNPLSYRTLYKISDFFTVLNSWATSHKISLSGSSCDGEWSSEMEVVDTRALCISILPCRQKGNSQYSGLSMRVSPNDADSSIRALSAALESNDPLDEEEASAEIVLSEVHIEPLDGLEPGLEEGGGEDDTLWWFQRENEAKERQFLLDGEFIPGVSGSLKAIPNSLRIFV